MKIRPVEAVVHADEWMDRWRDRQTERHDQNNNLFHTFANAPKNRIGQRVFPPIGFEVGTKEFQSVFKYFRM
jgi:hypothetical protein